MRCLTDDMMQYFLDAELSVAESNAVQVHIDHCKHCSDKVVKLNQERQKLLEMMDLLVDDGIDIPDFVPPLPKRNIKRPVVKLIMYGVVAAAMLVFLLHVLLPKHETNIPYISNQECVPVKMEESLMMEFDFANGVDANKPVHQQQMTITIIDVNGRIIDTI